MAPYLAHQANETAWLTAPDRTRLFVRHWYATNGQRRSGSALIVHGLGEHGGRYGHVAKVLNDCGLEVWAHDHRGFGNSDGARARIPEQDTLIDDAKFVFGQLQEQLGGIPLLLGHSMGGAIAARAVTGGWITPSALVLSSPGLKSYISAPMRAATSLLSRLLPNVAVPHGLPLHKISHDEAVLLQSAADPLNHARITPRLTKFILEAGEAAIRDAGKLSVPTLVQAAGDDRLVDPAGAREFAAAAPRGVCELRIYPGRWHEVYNERDREGVLSDLKDWLAAKLK